VLRNQVGFLRALKHLTLPPIEGTGQTLRQLSQLIQISTRPIAVRMLAKGCLANEGNFEWIMMCWMIWIGPVTDFPTKTPKHTQNNCES